MKNRNFVLGFLFIAFGVIWFLDNLGILDFELRYLIGGINDLWPLILVVIGINLLLKNKTIEKVIWILFLFILIGYSMFNQYSGTESNQSPNITNNNEIHSTAIEEGINKGKMDLDVGGMKFNVTSGTSEFVTLQSNLNTLNYDPDVNNNEQRIHISNSGEVIDFLGDTNYNLDMNLNESIPWNFDLDCGAIDGLLDLKNINVEEFDLDMGAGKMEIDLGSKSTHSQINISSGASQIILNIPKESGLRVNFEGALNSTNLSELDLIEQGNNSYISKNYEGAPSIYNLNVEMGLGEFKINYY